MRTRDLAATAAFIISAGSLLSPVAAHASTSTSSTSKFYVDNNPTTCSDATTDSATTPYCSIQAAVDHATSPGDTVLVSPSNAGYAPFTVSASGTSTAPITIVNALGDHFTTSLTSTARVESLTAAAAVTVSGASYVNIEGLWLVTDQAAVDITGSASHVTLDGNWIEQSNTATTTIGPAVVIAGGTSAITVSRNSVSSLANSTAVIAATGSSGDVFTTNSIEGAPLGPGILLSGTTDSDVTSNTLSAGCGSDVSAVAGSTGTSIENNILSELIPQLIGCSVADTNAAALTVDAASVTGTSADYNDVYLNPPSNSQMADYSWAGTRYTSASAFASATGQAVHDVNAGGVAAIDSANSAAPGELSTDQGGNARVDDPNVPNTGAGPYDYYDRGAIETQDPMSISLNSSWPTMMPLATPATFTASVTDQWTSVGIAGCTYTFGDGSSSVTVAAVNGACSTQHTYTVAGHYVIQLVATANDGVSVTRSARISASGADQLLPKVSVHEYSSREAGISDSGYHAWNIVKCVVDFGDGGSSTETDGGCGATHTYLSIGTFPVTITETDLGGNVASATGSFTASGYYFNPVAPLRVLDTRHAIGVPAVAKVAPGGVVRLQLAGTDGIPADAAAVAMNVTVTNAASGGYLTVYPGDTAMPTVSNLNFTAGAVVPNVVVVGLDKDGAVDLKNSSAGTVDVVADLEGYYAVTGQSYLVGSSYRVVDTRQSHQTIPANGTLRVNLNAPSIFTAATLNVTVTNPAAGGYVTAYPDETTMPKASNLNFTPHQTVANEVVVKIGSNGFVDFTNSSAGTVDLVVDYNGDFKTDTAGLAYTPIAPTRFLDTRNGTGDFQASLLPSGAMPGFGTGLLNIAGDTKITAVPVSAVAAALNITVTHPAAGGYITAYPSEQTTRPVGSVLNFSAGQTIANAASMLMTNPGPGGIYLYNGSAGSTQLVVDVFGYYS
ncbi:MAG TPA: NosD domain-containing protein [Actinocrinis sp.]|uniref:PKD domain-containing protein n=1 Tax=Actinocrinis sp. TaxID=1920516 RepID=UPI002DDCDCA1|nr:NosD domain-containing protein [Actinocrinis sp.]HEV2344035.1 NosD domain-containing protein [Actinocrinis sp.]